MKVFNSLKCPVDGDDFATIESDQILTTEVGLRVILEEPILVPPVLTNEYGDYSVLIDFNGNVLTQEA